MNRHHELNKLVQLRSTMAWQKLQAMYYELRGIDMPTVKLNARLYRTAGRCFQELQVVELGTKFFYYNPNFADEMFKTIIPHELIHAADYMLHGKSDRPCGHGLTWQKMMVQYGLPPETHHEMWIAR